METIKLFILSLLFLFSLSLNSQIVNIENKRIYDSSVGFSGNLSSSFSVIKNKYSLYLLDLNPRIQYKNKRNYFLLVGDVNYSKSKEKIFSNNGMLHFRYSNKISNSIGLESYIQSQYNLVLDQKGRYIIGTGIRYKIIEDKKKIKLFYGGSFLYEHEILQNHILENNLRMSNYISFYFNYNDNISINGTSYYQPNILKVSDYKLSGEYVISVFITKMLDINIVYDFFYDSNPPNNVINFIYNSKAGFKIKFGE